MQIGCILGGFGALFVCLNLDAMDEIQWTPVRRRIMNYFERKRRMLTVKDLLHYDTTLDKVTVYRTLEYFQKAGLVRELFLGNGEKGYELGDKADHHHHFRCEQCRELYHLPCEFEHFLGDWEHKTGFEFHNFDFSGICKKCLKLARV